MENKKVNSKPFMTIMKMFFYIAVTFFCLTISGILQGYPNETDGDTVNFLLINKIDELNGGQSLARSDVFIRGKPLVFDFFYLLEKVDSESFPSLILWRWSSLIIVALSFFFLSLSVVILTGRNWAFFLVPAVAMAIPGVTEIAGTTDDNVFQFLVLSLAFLLVVNDEKTKMWMVGMVIGLGVVVHLELGPVLAANCCYWLYRRRKDGLVKQTVIILVFTGAVVTCFETIAHFISPDSKSFLSLVADTIRGLSAGPDGGWRPKGEMGPGQFWRGMRGNIWPFDWISVGIIPVVLFLGFFYIFQEIKNEKYKLLGIYLIGLSGMIFPSIFHGTSGERWSACSFFFVVLLSYIILSLGKEWKSKTDKKEGLYAILIFFVLIGMLSSGVMAKIQQDRLPDPYEDTPMCIFPSKEYLGDMVEKLKGGTIGVIHTRYINGWNYSSALYYQSSRNLVDMDVLYDPHENNLRVESETIKKFMDRHNRPFIPVELVKRYKNRVFKAVNKLNYREVFGLALLE